MAASDKSVVVSSTTDFSSDSTVSDDWQELTKSDYAKVIFSDLLCNAASGTVECKFQITDNVHEDPNDYVGLFRIGYEDLSQCLVSKMLSQTKCEDDGKLQRCVFTSNELPRLIDGFYQFLYVTRDQEVCGASMPFPIKMSPLPLKDSSVDSSASENMDGGFLLVSSETERKVNEEPSEQEKASVQQNALSEQKKKEIAAWVSQNPDYYSLIEQIREHTFTIDALQQSKDLAMREVAQLYEILNTQNSELAQLKNMLAAYEEKIKMSQCLQDEKNNELIEMRNTLASYKEKMCKDLSLQEEKNVAITEMRKSLTAYEEKVKLYELLRMEKEEELSRVESAFHLQEEKLKASLSFQDQQRTEINGLKRELEEMKETQKAKECHQKNVAITEMRKSLTAYEEKVKLYELLRMEKEEELSRVESAFLLQEEKLKASLSFQDQQRTEINGLKRELEEMKETQKAKECHQVASEAGGHSMDSVIQKAQDLVHIVSDTIKNLDYTDEDEVEKFYQLKIQLLVILKKMMRATHLANTCDRNGLRKTVHSVVEKGARGSSCAGSTSCALESRDPVETIAVNTSTHEVQKTDIPTSSAETPSLSDSSEKEPANEDASKEEVVQRSSLNKAFESEVLEHQIIELPRLDVINEDTAKALQTDKPVDAEDIIVINRLTEKIIKRGFNLYEAIELVDDSASDSGSDVSEISECSSSIKKDMLCVSKVMEALSLYLSNQTSLDHLIVVEKEEDKNLIHRNKWDVLLQKCALRYQIELLLEHIEKQKEGIKKVSEKICDLLTKCMLLQDEVGESKAVCEKLQSVIDKKDMHISRLKGELELKNTLFCHFRRQKEELEYKTELAEKTVEDFRARIEEASYLYKKQYTEIERLSKKLRKCKSMKDKTKSSKGESSLISSDSSKTESSFEVVKTDSVQNINDSDTGEHMFEKASLVSKEKDQDSKLSTGDRFSVQSFLDVLNEKASLFVEPCCNAPTEAHLVQDKEIQVQINSNTETVYCTVPERCLTPQASAFDDILPSNPELKSGELISQTIDDKPHTETVECSSNQTASLFSDFASYEHFQEVIKESFANLERPVTSRNSQECSISCFMCKKIIRLGPETPIDLMNHLENEHSMKTCPFCGQLFEDAIPTKYFRIHVEQHFETQ